MTLLAAALALSVQSNAPPPLSLVLEPAEQTIVLGEVAKVTIRLANRGRTALTVLKLRDGSDSHVVTPSFGISVVPGSHTSHPKFPKRENSSCGNVNPVKESDFVTLGPGQSLELFPYGIRRFFPFTPDLGKYRMIAYYWHDARIVADKRIILGIEPPELLQRIADIQPFSLRSNEVTINVVPQSVLVK